MKVEKVYLNNALALEAMRSGEIAGIVHIGSKPNELFAKARPQLGIPLPCVEYSDKFRDDYVPAELTSADYPSLIPDGNTVRTISVQAVLAVLNWPPDSDRHRRCRALRGAPVRALRRLRAAPFQPGWKEMNLAGTIPGWTRFGPAQQILNKAGASSFVALDVARDAAPRTVPVDAAEPERTKRRQQR